MNRGDVTVLSGAPPLVVDLDGTLIRSDLLFESAFAHLGRNPAASIALFAALWRGKAALKAEIAAATTIDVEHLPYDPKVLQLIRQRRAEGHSVYLASASNERYVRAIADHLGLFDGWFGSTDIDNLSSERKARQLVEAFGEGGFDYVGNGRDDIPVWRAARRRIAVQPNQSVKEELKAIDGDASIIEGSMNQARDWAKLLRIHQWAKNALVFVPIVTAQRFDFLSVGEAVAAFLTFSLAASAIYILNDLVDLDADRAHPVKRHRPLAAGTVSIGNALALIPLLLGVAFAGAFAVSPALSGVLLVYLLATTAYTFVLKRKMVADVLTLAALYTLRVIAGATAIAVPMSEWLLGFSMFIFTALALIKRYVELTSRIDENLIDPPNRNYRKTDLDIVAALAAAAGFNAVTVFALYVSSDAVRPLYAHPKMLWLICPLLMYWIGRALLMAGRRLINDDPIIFALRDWNSYLVLALIGLILLGAK
jgi:4-hydroxybenzoate polyprenyltransferase/phosphoserine phosphatase